MKILFIILFISIDFLYSQTIADYEKVLTNDSTKQWVTDSLVIKSDGENCTNGIIYTFNEINRNAIRKVCKNKNWQIDTLDWKIEKSEEDEFRLKLSDGTNVGIDFLQENNSDKIFMRLIGLITPDKEDPILESKFFVNNNYGK